MDSLATTSLVGQNTHTYPNYTYLHCIVFLFLSFLINLFFCLYFMILTFNHHIIYTYPSGGGDDGGKHQGKFKTKLFKSFLVDYSFWDHSSWSQTMGDTLHLVIGIMGNAASLLLYSAPILTFKRVIKKRCTEGFSCVPYIVALLNCLLYTWYGLPIVSNKWENLPLVTINGMGILLEFCFIFIYFCFASPKGKKMVCLAIVPVITVFCITALISGFALHDHHHRKVLVGGVGLVASVAMYGSPLVVVKQVIQTKSVEFMPFYLSLFSFLACSLWMTYGLVGHDIVLASPNIVGCPLGVLQLVVYFMYRKKEITEEPEKAYLEKNGEGLKFQQPVISCMNCNK